MIQSWYDDDYHDDGAKIDGGITERVAWSWSSRNDDYDEDFDDYPYDYDDDDDCDDNGKNEEGGLVKQRRERLPFPWSISSFFQQLMVDPEPPELLVIRTCILNHQMFLY